MKKDQGLLIMASHSIGQSGDIPARSLESLRTADLLIFEEDRGARAALKAAGIHRDYLRYNEHNQTQSLETITENLRAGKSVVYMSDQGCPGLADPGRAIVNEGIRAQARITTIPGPSSLTSAIAVCPFDLGEFHFGGFPPRDTAAREAKLSEWESLGVPVVLMDTPYRLEALLESCRKIFGDGHKATLAIDLSGEAENVINDSLTSIATATKGTGKLNFVLILDAGRKRGRTSTAPRPASPGERQPSNHAPVRNRRPRNRRRTTAGR
ncbi:hypothetical protein EBZ80_09850 [bacterium]|nr:hypothetical protein [bacterium]